MQLDTLIEQLTEMQAIHGGEMEVRVNADHGQTAMAATYVSAAYIDQDTYMPESINDGDLEEFPDAIQVIEIQGY
ncbi:hypothetical protein [Brumicola nitratireducens]|uniref:Uncharacterized protein n=1 Tax=Glaciecola nitratireducens (strain JCM 12485 / KCTC 12276 / FR1064) TaxID=1085623 RepID=G4QGX7_GLANF|nr:hypothetical protein [Glaciecola nitratireducens]AEP29922.1 hypothetical protein GNIT_1812 [Glaciecola nitratireducens FR1064]